MSPLERSAGSSSAGTRIKCMTGQKSVALNYVRAGLQLQRTSGPDHRMSQCVSSSTSFLLHYLRSPLLALLNSNMRGHLCSMSPNAPGGGLSWWPESSLLPAELQLTCTVSRSAPLPDPIILICTFVGQGRATRTVSGSLLILNSYGALTSSCPSGLVECYKIPKYWTSFRYLLNNVS